MFCITVMIKKWPAMRQGLVMLLLAMSLTACSSNNERKPVDGEIKINLFADKDINPNEKGAPAPLNIFIYNVKEIDVFNNADFFEIVDENSQPLQAAASRNYAAILQPGESRTLFIKPDSDTQALGFVGAYRNLDDSLWLVSWDLPQKEPRSWWQTFFSDDALELNAHFKKTAITIKKWIKP